VGHTSSFEVFNVENGETTSAACCFVLVLVSLKSLLYIEKNCILGYPRMKGFKILYKRSATKVDIFQLALDGQKHVDPDLHFFPFFTMIHYKLAIPQHCSSL